ncbi:MAG TPA: glutamine amidotransferase [Syntrophomonadaceae bacterium]|nr:glutamine amidotransferase [Syntrophomonadaceae bacterium]
MSTIREINLAHLYPNLMDLYGDRGNLIVLKKRLEWYGHKANIININLGEPLNLDKYDMLFMGGGIEKNQIIVGQEILPYADEIKDYIEQGSPVLFISAAFQLLGTTYNSRGEKSIGLDLFDFYTEKATSRWTNNILLKVQINDREVDVVGFENHIGRTYFVNDKIKPFGTVIKGYGNNKQDKSEGIRYKNLIGTYLHGPLLPKNPIIADFFINCMLADCNYPEGTALNDELEWFAHEQAKRRLVN